MMIKVVGPAGQCCMFFTDYRIVVGEEDKVVHLLVHDSVDTNSPSDSVEQFDYPDFDKVYVMDHNGDTKDSFNLHQWDPTWLAQQEQRRLEQEKAELERLGLRVQRPLQE